MNPALLVFGIKATLRAAQAGADLYGEHSRDRKIFLPDLKLPKGTRSVQLQQFLTENFQLINDIPELAAIWDDNDKILNSTKSEDVDEAYVVMLEYEAKSQLDKEGKDVKDAKLLAAGCMVEQWREERKPPSAIVRMALTLTDIGLEYVTSNPSVLGVGSRGEKLIAAFAVNMSDLIPNDVSAFGPETDFADRVLGIFLHAGLGSLASNATTIFRDEDIARLFTGVTKPIVQALPDSIAQQIQYRDLVDALAGPSAEAAFRLLAENTETYLGKNFADDKALGAVTSALFEEIKITTHAGTIVDVFSEQGVIRLYQASLGIAVKRPGLFIGDDDSAKTRLIQDLFSGAAAILRENPRLKGPIGASLAAMTIEAVGNNAPALLKLDPENPWEKVAVVVLKQVTTSLAMALNNIDGNGLTKGALKFFSDEQILELGRVILVQIAKTPGMLGVEQSEVQSIIAGIAEAMAEDDNLLLSPDEWIKIVGIAVQKAASNPGRLFGFSMDEPGEALAATIIKSVLKVAGNTWATAGRSGKPLLFGETLELILEATIVALAGNISAVVDHPELVEQFLVIILEQASAAPGKIGSDGLVKVFRVLIGNVLADGTLPTEQEITEALSE
ncbi:MAG: hypothetical protein K8R67_07015 [Desulfobacteraceae bacterium]|nr:hypothetical protein [Desulfobacteraceae bacterium]